jgi:hypothetical protein
MHPLVPLTQVLISVPAKLSDDDVFLAWTGIVIPSAAAVASVFVASVSVFIAWKARKIAEDSELARVKAEADRVRYEQEQRLDSALRDLFVGISKRISEVLAHPANFERALGSGEGLRGAPTRPDPSSVLVLIAAARLEARQPQEREMLETVRPSFRISLSASKTVRSIYGRCGLIPELRPRGSKLSVFGLMSAAMPTPATAN